MPTMIQVRNVPDALHRRLKARAARSGMSMSEYVLREIRRGLERPTRDDLLARLARFPTADLDPEPAELLRQERERR